MPRPRKDPKPAAVPVAAAPQPIPLVPQQAPAPAPVSLMPQGLPADNNAAPLVINRAEYVRVRDSVHARLSTIQELLRDFAADYLRQSNLLLGEPTSLDNVPGLQSLARLDQSSMGFAPPPPVEALPPVEEKKERKKRQHDPNAPKRPLTPYFLYMQTARPIIANDLGDAPKGAVQDEGQRRWASMSASEKMAWNNAYQFNLRLYHARVHSYKNGNVNARDMPDQDALAYADANQIQQPTLNGAAAEGAEEPPVADDQDAITEQLQMNTPAAAAPPVAAPPSATTATDDVKQTPKPKGSTRKRKSTAAATDGEDTETAAKTATPASPDKKRKRNTKASEPATEEPKKSARKKKNA